MAKMKALYIEMTDPVNVFHENEELDYVRRQAWNDAIAGLYVPETYKGDARAAYDIGRQQVEEFCHEEGIDLFNDVLEPTIQHQTLTPVEDEIDDEELAAMITPDGLPSDEEWAALFKDIEETR